MGFTMGQMEEITLGEFVEAMLKTQGFFGSRWEKLAFSGPAVFSGFLLLVNL